MQAALLPDGEKLHLNAGPIDLIIFADAGHRDQCFRSAGRRFNGLLEELVSELPELRSAAGGSMRGPVAQRMAAAVAPYAPEFITPMAAVAGAVAEEILLAMRRAAPDAEKLWVNNGGDIAWHLARGEIRLAMPGGALSVPAASPMRGCATSGQGGRSHSLGIADAVTVLAETASVADAAATMIANHVDLPEHPAISHMPACALSPDSDLGELPVTTEVGLLSAAEVDVALSQGLSYADVLYTTGRIGAAHLFLQGQSRQVGGTDLAPTLSLIRST